MEAFPDGRVVSGSGKLTVEVRDVESGQVLATLAGRQGPPVAVLSEGRMVSGSWDGTVRVWDVESGQVLAKLAGHQGVVSAGAVFPDGRVVSGSDDNTLRVWDAVGNVWFIDLP